MFYTIIAAVAFIISTLLFARNIFQCQNVETGRFFDREYGREFKIVKATVSGISIVGKNRYAVTCNIDDKNTYVDIEMSPDRLKRLRQSDTLYLIEYSTAKAKLYCVAPLSDMGLQGLPFFEKDEASRGEDTDGLDQKAQSFHKLNMVLILLAFFTCPTTAMTSILLSILASILAIFVIPLMPWTRAKGFAIIKKEASNVKKQDQTSKIPIGFDDWSDTSKELYSIEQRLRNTAQNVSIDPDDSSSDAEETTESTESEGENCEDEVLDVTLEVKSKDEPPRCCRVCGCIVSKNAQFCESCGNKLTEDDNPTVEVKTEPSQPHKASEPCPEQVLKPEPKNEPNPLEKVNPGPRQEKVSTSESKLEEKSKLVPPIIKEQSKPASQPEKETASIPKAEKPVPKAPGPAPAETSENAVQRDAKTTEELVAPKPETQQHVSGKQKKRRKKNKERPKDIEDMIQDIQ